MIRFVVGLFVFAVALCAYIVNLPDGNGRGAQRALPATQVDVTRAGSEAAVPLPNAIMLGDFASSAAPASPFATNSDPLIVTIENILLGLGLETDRLGSLAAQAPGPQTRLEMFILQSLQARTPDDEINAEVNTMARDQLMTVPDVLVTADGQVDVQALLAAIIHHVEIATGEAPRAPVALADHPELVWQNGQASYRVIGPDSLAGLAQRIYGDVTRTDLILVANPDVLSSADRIKPGQVLVIPAI